MDYREGNAAPQTPLAAANEPRGPSSEWLLGEQHVLLIEHRGEVYRLRVTLGGELILSK